MTSGGRAGGGASGCAAPNSKSSLIHISRGQRPGIARQGYPLLIAAICEDHWEILVGWRSQTRCLVDLWGALANNISEISVRVVDANEFMSGCAFWSYFAMPCNSLVAQIDVEACYTLIEKRTIVFSDLDSG